MPTAMFVFGLGFVDLTESDLGADVDVELVVDLHPREQANNNAKATALRCRDRFFIGILQSIIEQRRPYICSLVSCQRFRQCL